MKMWLNIKLFDDISSKNQFMHLPKGLKFDRAPPKFVHSLYSSLFGNINQFMLKLLERIGEEYSAFFVPYSFITGLL
jgi:hypothetical protein